MRLRYKKREDTAPFKTGTTQKRGTPGGEVSSIYSLLKQLQDVKQNLSKNLVLDRDYMQAARNGDEEKAAEYVEKTAKEWGAFSDSKPARIANRLIKQLSVVGVPFHNKLRSLHSSAIMYRQPSCGAVF